jgi:hypothetical protein
MKWPPYPRIPHLASGLGITRDDVVLSDDDRERLLSGGVRVEEKLDGANVSFALGPDREVLAATRGGPDTIDRGGHLGRARAWAAERSDALASLLADGSILYGEWLLTRHSVRYAQLPDLFVGFDLLHPIRGWASVEARDEGLTQAGITTPPALGDFRGIQLAKLDVLLGPSKYGAPQAEGLIVRALSAEDGRPRVAKRLAGVPPTSEEAFRARRQENRLAHRSAQA